MNQQQAPVSSAYAIVGTIGAVGSTLLSVYRTCVFINYESSYMLDYPLRFIDLLIFLTFVVSSSFPFWFIYRKNITTCMTKSLCILLGVHVVLAGFIVGYLLRFEFLDTRDLFVLLSGGLGLLMALLRGKAILSMQQQEALVPSIPPPGYVPPYQSAIQQQLYGQSPVVPPVQPAVHAPMQAPMMQPMQPQMQQPKAQAQLYPSLGPYTPPAGR